MLLVSLTIFDICLLILWVPYKHMYVVLHGGFYTLGFECQMFKWLQVQNPIGAKLGLCKKWEGAYFFYYSVLSNLKGPS